MMIRCVREHPVRHTASAPMFATGRLSRRKLNSELNRFLVWLLTPYSRVGASALPKGKLFSGVTQAPSNSAATER